MTEIVLIIANILLSIYGAISFFENRRLRSLEKYYQKEIEYLRLREKLTNHKIELPNIRHNVDSITIDKNQIERFFKYKGFSETEMRAWALNEFLETRRKNAKASMTNKKFKSDEDAYEYYLRNGGDSDFNIFLTLGLLYVITDDSNSKSSSSYDYSSGSSWD